MKRTKRITGMILALVLMIGIFPVMPVHASGNVTISVSSSSVNIGDTVTVTAKASGPNGEEAIAKLGFNYDSGKFSFVSCSESTYSGGGGGYVGVVSSTASITLKAIAAGTASVTVSGSDGVNINDETAEYGELSAGGTKLTVNNAAGNADGQQNNSENNGDNNANKSGDNSLSTLTISPGTLSPSFQYSVTNYTASVGADVTSIAVDAKTSNDKATVESVTGHTDLKPGQNTISIVVKAENGTTATYKIVVTRGGEAQEPPQEEEEEKPEEETPDQEQGGITINGNPFNLSATVPDDVIPKDFTKTTITYQGQQVEGLQFEKGTLTLVYLTTPSTEVKNTLAVYDEASGAVYPFRKVDIGEKYIILLDPPAETGLGTEYTPATASVEGFENVPVFVAAGQTGAKPEEGANPEGENSQEGANPEGENSQEGAKPEGENSQEGTTPEGENSQEGTMPEFSLIYGISSYGNKGWYQYDTTEGFFQRYVQTAAVQTPEEPEKIDDSTELKSLQKSNKDLEEQLKKRKDSSRRIIAVMVFLIAVLLIIVINLILRNRNQDWEEEDDLPYEEPKPRARKRASMDRDWNREDWEDDVPEERPRRKVKKDAYEGDRENPQKKVRKPLYEEDWENRIPKERSKPKKAVSQETKPIVKPEVRQPRKQEPSLEPRVQKRTEKISEPRTQKRTERSPEPRPQKRVERAPEPKPQKRVERAPEPKIQKKAEQSPENDFEVIDLEDL